MGAGALVAAGYVGRRQMGSMEDYKASVATTRAALAKHPTVTELIRYATLAASGHNTQPWKFKAGPQRVEIRPDLMRRTPVVDPDDHHIFVSLGCAGENLALAAAAHGYAGEFHFEGGSLVFDFGPGSAIRSDLYLAIPHRQSTRSEFAGKSVSANDLASLTAAARTAGVEVVILTEKKRMDQIRDLVLAGNSAQLKDRAFLRELKSWLRFSPRDAIRSGDGLFSAASGNPALPSWLGPGLFELVLKLETENAKYAAQIDSSAGLVVFVGEADEPEHWVQVGRACQRFALQATALGLKHAFINQPVEVARLRPELAALLGLPGRRPDIVMRFGYAEPLPFSARRPVSAVLA